MRRQGIMSLWDGEIVADPSLSSLESCSGRSQFLSAVIGRLVPKRDFSGMVALRGSNRILPTTQKRPLCHLSRRRELEPTICRWTS